MSNPVWNVLFLKKKKKKKKQFFNNEKEQMSESIKNQTDNEYR